MHQPNKPKPYLPVLPIIYGLGIFLTLILVLLRDLHVLDLPWYLICLPFFLSMLVPCFLILGYLLVFTIQDRKEKRDITSSADQEQAADDNLSKSE